MERHPVPQRPEQVFTYGSPRLKVGPGAVDEIGHDVRALGASSVLVVTDPGVAAAGGPQRVCERLREAGLRAVLFDRVRVEPTDASLQEAAELARGDGPFDAVVAVGGGSAIDTAKAVALLLTNDGAPLDYVNAPVGAGRAPQRPLLPLVAVPTTTGTGAESTTVCVLDVPAQRVKSGISHERLRPVLAVVDPELVVSQPPTVTACAGLDVLCHALESWTARPYTSYERREPAQRVPYCGANPISDLWCEQALRLLAGSLRRAVADGQDVEARTQMTLAATFAGMGFGNAGVHLPHANAYPVAGQVRDFRPPDYPADHAMVPHGMAVALTAPASFRRTFAADPQRHLHAARLLAPDAPVRGDEADHLPAVLTDLLRDVGMPNGLAALGYSADHVPALAEGTLQQQRLLSMAPLPLGRQDVEQVLTDSLVLW